MLAAGAAVAGGAWVAPAVLGFGLPVAAAASPAPGGGTLPPTTATSLLRVLVVFADSACANFYSLAYEYDCGSWQQVKAGSSLGGAGDPAGGLDDTGLLLTAGFTAAYPTGATLTSIFSIAGGATSESLTIDGDPTGDYVLLEGIVATILTGSTASAGFAPDTVVAGYTPLGGGVDSGPPDVSTNYPAGSPSGPVSPSSITFTAPVLS
jgi:hypothetical protein